MRATTLTMMATMLTVAPAFGQGAGTALVPAQAVAGEARPGSHANQPKPAVATSTPESRSAAALALSHEPTFDEGTAQRIKEAAESYANLAIRGGWPAIPSDAKFALGVQGPNDDLLRQRLIISGDLAPDRVSGAFDDVLAQAVTRFQQRHGLAPTGSVTPRTLAALKRPRAEADQAA